jgi:hypothetical protein
MNIAMTAITGSQEAIRPGSTISVFHQKKCSGS